MRRADLYAPVIRAPIADAFFDLLSAEIVFQRLLGQFNDLVIGSETQGNQLILAEPIDLRVPLLRREGLEAEPFFEANHAVLHFERVSAELDQRNSDCQREN